MNEIGGQCNSRTWRSKPDCKNAVVYSLWFTYLEIKNTFVTETKGNISMNKKRQKYEFCPESIQPCTMKNRDIYGRRYKKHCTQDNEASVPLKVGTLGPHTVLSESHLLFKTLCKIFCWNFPESQWWSEISSLSKVLLVLGKVRRHKVPTLGCKGAKSPGLWY